MGKQVTVKSGFNYFRGPSPKGYRAYSAGATVVYTDAEYAALSAADLRAISTSTNVADPGRPATDPASRPVNVVAAATGAAPVALGPNKLTLVGNITLSFPTGVASGNQSSVDLYLTQDATGSRLLTLPASAKAAGGTAPVLSTGAGKTDFLRYITTDGGTTWLLVEKQLDLR